MKIKGNKLKKGNIIHYQGHLWVVAKTEPPVKPGKGGAYAPVELKNIIDGTKLNELFRSDETLEKVHLDETPCQYLYKEDNIFIFMDMENFEQIPVQKDVLGSGADFLKEEMTVTLQRYEGKVIAVDLPEQAILEIKETEPTIKGQTASNSYKPAILENGVRIMVPPFVSSGERIIVNIEDRSYVGRSE